jgi:Tol biopolymer transport system component
MLPRIFISFLVVLFSVWFAACNVLPGNEKPLNPIPPESEGEPMLAFSGMRNMWPGAFQMYILDADGSNLRQLTDARSSDSTTPFWSPDGEHLPYTTSERSHSWLADVYVMSVDDWQPRRLTDGNALNHLISWLPASDELAFYSMRRDTQESMVYIVRADGSERRELPALRDYHNINWTPDGQQIVMTDRTLEPQIFIAEADGTNARQLTSDPLPKFDVVLSPDGQQIAFVSEGNAQDEQYQMFLYVMDIDGSNVRRIGEIAAYNTGEFAWSPDSQRLAFVGYHEDTYAVYIGEADGSNTQYLANMHEGDASGEVVPSIPVWEDNQHVLYSSLPRTVSTGNFSVYRLDVSSGERTMLVGRSPSFFLIYDLSVRP